MKHRRWKFVIHRSVHPSGLVFWTIEVDVQSRNNWNSFSVFQIVWKWVHFDTSSVVLTNTIDIDFHYTMIVTVEFSFFYYGTIWVQSKNVLNEILYVSNKTYYFVRCLSSSEQCHFLYLATHLPQKNDKIFVSLKCKHGSPKFFNLINRVSIATTFGLNFIKIGRLHLSMFPVSILKYYSRWFLSESNRWMLLVSKGNECVTQLRKH